MLKRDKAMHVLLHLEQAAVLRAEEHQGSRYFELGHDWLARKVFEFRQRRMRREGWLRKLQARARQEAPAAADRRGSLLALALLRVGLFIWALDSSR